MKATALALLAAPFLAAVGDDGPAGLDELNAYSETLEGERRQGAEFLLEHLPEGDRDDLPLALFRENLEVAFKARETYPWTRDLPQDLFFNDVLPHAVVDETRDPWRERLHALFAPRLGDCETIRDVATVVAERIAGDTGVSYSTEREKACQSPAESMRQGMASCTGLSILMVDSLRAVGVPARLAGIALWGTREGNHTWIEIHDGDAWQHANYGGGPDTWNTGWEIERCAYCDPLEPLHGVFATSYRPTGLGFPMIWDWRRGRHDGPLHESGREEDGRLTSLSWTRQDTRVPAIDRTRHYVTLAGGRKFPMPEGMAVVSIRAFAGDDRRAVPVRVFRRGDLIFEGRTASEARDLNDYVRVVCEPGELRIEHRPGKGAWKSRTLTAPADEETEIRLDLSSG